MSECDGADADGNGEDAPDGGGDSRADGGGRPDRGSSYRTDCADLGDAG